MENLEKALSNMMVDETIEVNEETAKLEQKTRNRYKTIITEAILADIDEAIKNIQLPEGAEPFLLARVDKGIGISVWTEHGYIPIFIEASMKGLDFDVYGAAEEYKAKLAKHEEDKLRAQKRKEAKIAQDAALREQKRKQREARGLTPHYEEYKG